VVAWFISFLFSYYSSHNVLTELEFYDRPMKLGSDENICEPGTGLSQINWWQKQDNWSSFTSARPKFRIFLDKGFNFMLVMDLLYKVYLTWAGCEPAISVCGQHEMRWGRQQALPRHGLNATGDGGEPVVPHSMWVLWWLNNWLTGFMGTSV
jgi:hypothetical protein